MYNKDIYEELAYKFSYLSNLKPDGLKSNYNMLDLGISDKFVQKFSPMRYSFYMKLLKELSNPKVLKNVLYENKLIKSNKERESADVEEISNMIRHLYVINSDDAKYMNEQKYSETKKERIKDVNEALKKKLKFAIKQNYDDSGGKLSELVDSLFIENPYEKKETVSPTGASSVGGSSSVLTQDQNSTIDREVEEYKEKMKKTRDNFDKSGINKYTDLLENINNNEDKWSASVKTQKLQDVLLEMEGERKKFNLTKEDKLVFIGVTFVIRLLSLMIIDWSMTSNFIVNFYQAYLLYIGLYCIFLLLVLVIVNMTYIMPIDKLYGSNHSFASTLASVFYFFYLVPGKMLSSSLRLGVHLGVIVLMTIIALFIVYNPKNNEGVISYDYTEKRNIRNQLNNFTLILWMFTSFLAMYYRS